MQHQTDGMFGWLYDIGMWVAKMMYLHLLWVMFTILGLGLFGITPATIAMMTIFQRWFEGDPDVPIFQTFKSVYKKQFITANKLGLLMIGAGLFLLYDYYISKTILQVFIIHVGLLIVIILYGITLLYLLPVFVRYELKFFQYIKQAFLVALAQPFSSIGMIICLLIVYYMLIIVPALFVFIGSSIIFYLISQIAYRAFLKIEKKKVENIS